MTLLSDDDNDNGNHDKENGVMNPKEDTKLKHLIDDHSKSIDRRPFEQRVQSPRKARRMNHSFMHLYR